MNRRPPKNGEIREKKENVLLIDGNALFKAGFFGAKNEYNYKGQHIGGIYQFITVLRKLLTEDLYHKVFVFWDGNFSGKLRYELYPLYKSDRGKDYENGTKPQDKDELFERKVVMQYLEDLFVRQMEDSVVESDDLIAYFCLNKKSNVKITICSNDSDLIQLINNDIKIYYLPVKNYITNSNFSEYFCYHKDNAALVKSIIGDTADSIKGIKNLGLKTLINLFPELSLRKMSLKEIINQAKKISEERKNNKKKPLLAIENLINSNTDSILGDKVLEVNYKVVDLTKPFITEKAKKNLKELIESNLNPNGRDIKNVISYIERDGLKKTIGENRYDNYLLPFKELINREKKLL